MTEQTISAKKISVAQNVNWRSFRMAAWLGWQIESNWADAFLFAVYSIVKPLASAAILVVMYGVISGGTYTQPIFPYIYLGNAFYIYVGALLTGVSWTIIQDREEYRTFKYMYVAPLSMPFYLLGRGVAKFMVASVSVLITILAGVLFLHVEIDWLHVNWGFFFLILLIGVAMLSVIGLLLAGLTMLIVKHSGVIGEAVAGLLYLFSGAIFPLDVLPKWLQPIGFFMPLTYWLELLRRALVGQVAQAFPTLSGYSNNQLLAILLGLTLFFSFLSVWIFRVCERKARERGLLDYVSNY